MSDEKEQSCDKCLSMEFSSISAKKEMEAKIKELEEKLKKSVSRETELENSLYATANQSIEQLDKIQKLEANLKIADTNIKSFVISAGSAEDYRRILDSNILDRDQTIDKMKSFLHLLDRDPCFWGWSYKKNIKQFLIDNNIYEY